VRGGGNRLSDSMKVLRGTSRADRLPAVDVPVPAIRARCPRWLSPLAKRCWRFLFSRLVAAARLRESDLPALALCCEHYALAVAAAESLHRDFILIPDLVHGGVKSSPALRALRESSEAYRAYAASFGLTPADRQRLAPLAPAATQDDLMRFLASRPVGPGKDKGDDDDGNTGA